MRMQTNTWKAMRMEIKTDMNRAKWQVPALM